jgi:hypothetical protein
MGKDGLYAMLHHKCDRKDWLASGKRDHKMMPTHLMARDVIDGNERHCNKLGDTNRRRSDKEEELLFI